MVGLPTTDVEYPLAGEDRKTDAPHVLPNKVLRAENVQFREPGAYNKRLGFDRLGNSIIEGGTLTDVRRVLAEEDAMLAVNEHGLFSYSPQIDAWSNRGYSPRFLLAQNPVSRPAPNFNYTPFDCAYANGMIVVLWREETGANFDARYQVIDAATNEVVLDGSIVGLTSTVVVRLVAAGTNVHIVHTGSAIDTIIIDTTDGSVASASTLLAGTLSNWDVAPVFGSTEFVIGGRLASDGTLRMYHFDSAGTLLTTSVSGGTPVGGAITQAAVCAGSTEDAYLFFWDPPSTEWYVVAWEMDALTTVSVTLAAFTTSPTGSAGGLMGATRLHANAAAAAYTYTHSVSGEVETRFIVVDDAGTQTPSSSPADPTGIKRTQIASLPFVHDDRACVVLRYVPLNSTARDPCYVIYEFSSATEEVYTDGHASTPALQPRLMATFARGLAGGLATTAASHRTPRVVERATDHFIVPLPIATSFETIDEASIAIDEFGVDLFTFDGRSDPLVDSRFLAARWGDGIMVAGAQVMVYDGEHITDAGMIHRPDILDTDIVMSGIGTGSLPAGDYRYALVFEWRDSGGRLHRSAPSDVHTLTAAMNDLATITIPPLLPGNRHLTPNDVSVGVYRSDTDAEPMYFLKRVAIGTATVTDDGTDTLDETQPLYTDSGHLSNFGPPACSHLAAHNKRLFAATEKNVIAFTKRYADGIAPEWVQGAFEIPIPEAGRFRGLISIDTALLAFDDRGQIFAILGDGPEATGIGDPFRVQRVNSDVGSKNPRSLARDPQGVWFEAAKGMMRIDRGFQIQPAGAIMARAFDQNGDAVTGAVIRRDHFETMFSLAADVGEPNDGHALMHDHFVDEWAEHLYALGSAVVSMAETEGRLFFAAANGRVYREKLSGYEDHSVDYPQAVELPVTAQGTIANWRRAYELLIVGENHDTHGLVVRFKYDDEADNVTGWDDTVTVPASSITADGYPREIPFPRQKFRTCRVRIEEAELGSTGRGAGWSAVVAKIGLKRLAKQASGRVGTGA